MVVNAHQIQTNWNLKYYFVYDTFSIIGATNYQSLQDFCHRITVASDDQS